MKPIYDDNYSTCEETYSTLRIYHDEISPTEVTKRLNLTPTSQFIKGEKSNSQEKAATVNGWFLKSKTTIGSRDSRRHIDWIIDQIWSKKDELVSMVQEGYQIDISSYWVSSTGHGGPVLSPYQMTRLGDLQIEVWWDIYI